MTKPGSVPMCICRRRLAAKPDGADDPLTASEGVAAAVTIILAVIMLVIGYRMLRLAAAIATMYVVFGAMFCLFRNVGIEDPAVLFWASLSVGLVASLIVLCYFYIGLFLLGCIGGAALALWMLSWSVPPFIPAVGWRWVFIAVLALVGGIAVFFFKRILAIITTAIAGSVMLFAAIDAYANTGFVEAIGIAATGKDEDPSVFTPAAYGMCIACIVTAGLSMLLQFRITGKGDHHSDPKPAVPKLKKAKSGEAAAV